MQPQKPHLPDVILFPLARNVRFLEPEKSFFKIVKRKASRDIEVFLTGGGLLGLKFTGNSGFTGGEVDRFDGIVVPDDAFQQEQTRKTLSFKRVRLANAVSLLLSSAFEEDMNRPAFSHYMINAFAVSSASLDGEKLSMFPQEMETIFNFRKNVFQNVSGRQEDVLISDPDLIDRAFENVKKGFDLSPILTDFSLFENLSFLKQARVLHSEQAFDASFVIGWAALEALIDLSFKCFRIIPVSEPNFLQTAHAGKVPLYSMTKFKKLGLQSKVEILCEHKLVKNIHATMFDEMRLARNNLMHDAEPISPDLSGRVATFSRDFYGSSLNLIVKPEGGYSMRT